MAMAGGCCPRGILEFAAVVPRWITWHVVGRGGHPVGECHKRSSHIFLSLFLCMELMEALTLTCGVCSRVGLLTLMSQDLLKIFFRF